MLPCRVYYSERQEGERDSSVPLLRVVFPRSRFRDKACVTHAVDAGVR